jgi:hypothetical protein
LLYSYSSLSDTSIGTVSTMLAFTQIHTDNVYAGIKLTYDYKDVLSLSAHYIYRNWNSDNNEYLLAVKPENEASMMSGLYSCSTTTVRFMVVSFGCVVWARRWDGMEIANVIPPII